MGLDWEEWILNRYVTLGQILGVLEVILILAVLGYSFRRRKGKK
jgi:hypothetical protein